MFRIILDKCNKLKYYPDPFKVHLDFKISIINTLKDIIGSHLIVLGCLLCQSTHQKLGLETKFWTAKDLIHFCAMLGSLEFLSLNYNYFDSISISGHLCRIGTNDNLSIWVGRCLLTSSSITSSNVKYALNILYWIVVDPSTCVRKGIMDSIILLGIKINRYENYWKI